MRRVYLRTATTVALLALLLASVTGMFEEGSASSLAPSIPGRIQAEQEEPDEAEIANEESIETSEKDIPPESTPDDAFETPQDEVSEESAVNEQDDEPQPPDELEQPADQDETESPTSNGTPETITSDHAEVDSEAAPVEAAAGGELAARAVSTSGIFLSNVCFDYWEASAGVIIDSGCDLYGTGIAFPEVPPGTYFVRQYSGPPGYAAVLPIQQTAILEGETTTVEFVNEPVGVGELEVHKVDQDNQPLSYACFSLQQNEESIDERCDSGDGAGILRFPSIPPGDYLLVETLPPWGYEAGPSQPVSIEAGALTSVTVQNSPIERGTLVIHKTDEHDEPLAGACFLVSTADGPDKYAACDSDDGNDDGTITFGNLVPGEWTLYETVTPPGYASIPAVNDLVSIASGETTETTVVNQHAAEDLVISTVEEIADEVFVPVPGACYYLSGYVEPTAGPGYLAYVCDGVPSAADNGVYSADTELDGIVVISGLAPGSYTVGRDPGTPPGFFDVGPGSAPVEVSAGVGAALEFVLARGGYVGIEKTDEEYLPLGGACFAVEDQESGDWYEQCDQLGFGYFHFGLPFGSYVVYETVSPPGYALSEPFEFELAPGLENQFQVVNVLGGFDVTVRKIDEHLDPLQGACFGIAMDSGGAPGRILTRACDDADSAMDGTIRMHGLPAGSYWLVETVTPLGFIPGAPLAFEIVNADVELTVQNQRDIVDEYGSLEIHKVDKHGKLLPGACYDLYDPVTDVRLTTPGIHCDGGSADSDGQANGIYTFSNNVVGTLVVGETQAPAGYEGGASQSVTIPAGTLVKITFVNYPSGGENPNPPTPTHPAKPGKPGEYGKPQAPSGASATQLPVTGTGASSSSGIPDAIAGFLTIFTLAVTYGTISFKRRHSR